jgi:hypothetical protein
VAASQALAHHLTNTCGGLSGGDNISLSGRIFQVRIVLTPFFCRNVAQLLPDADVGAVPERLLGPAPRLHLAAGGALLGPVDNVTICR